MNVIRTQPFYKGVTKELRSPMRSGVLTYAEGTTVEADGINKDANIDCGQGINFCRSIAEALHWGPVVVEIRIPPKTVVVDTGAKLRAKRVMVGPVVNLTDANLTGANLTDANLTGASLWGANLTGANLWGASLRGANLWDASLTGANLRGANLWDANLTGANLRGANLWDANLTGANLWGANLTGANLWGANLWGAYLTGANLGGAHLGGANLGGAYLRGAQGNGATVLPNGYEVDASGLIVRVSI